MVKVNLKKNIFSKPLFSIVLLATINPLNAKLADELGKAQDTRNMTTKTVVWLAASKLNKSDNTLRNGANVVASSMAGDLVENQRAITTKKVGYSALFAVEEAALTLSVQQQARLVDWLISKVWWT